MQFNDMLEGLTGRVHRILQILADGRKSLFVPEASEWKALALARWDLMRALDDFRTFKEAAILAPIIAVGGDAAEQGRTIAARNEALELAYQAFVRRWALNGPLAIDTPYKKEALAIAATIERQVIADVQEIEALVQAAAATIG